MAAERLRLGFGAIEQRRAREIGETRRRTITTFGLGGKLAARHSQKNRTMKLLALLCCLFVLADACPAQTRSQLKKDLRVRESKAVDADSLMETAKWAESVGLLTDYKRLLNKIVKKDPDHEGAMTGLGYLRYEGKWMKKEKAEALLKKDLQGRMKAKGMVEFDGAWVEKSAVEDAKQGIFHHEGEIVNRADKIALQRGDVRHPVTGIFISKDDVSKAEAGLFPLGNGKWGDRKEADKFHADPRHPWVLRTYHATVLSALPLDKIEKTRLPIDSTVEFLRPLFGGNLPHPDVRPIIMVATDATRYSELGAAVGAEGSAYDVFLSSAVRRGGGVEGRPAITYWHESWVPYWVRHATALAVAHSFAERAGTKLPEWFLRGIGEMAARNNNDVENVRLWFHQQHLKRGGVKDLDSWLSKFRIAPDLERRQLDYNIYQAGLVIRFCMNGGDTKATDALMAVTKAFDKDGRSVDRAIANLKKLIPRKEKEIREYFQKLIQG